MTMKAQWPKTVGIIKSSSKREFEVIQSYLNKQEKYWIDKLTLHLKQLGKEEQKPPKSAKEKKS